MTSQNEAEAMRVCAAGGWVSQVDNSVLHDRFRLREAARKSFLQALTAAKLEFAGRKYKKARNGSDSSLAASCVTSRVFRNFLHRDMIAYADDLCQKILPAENDTVLRQELAEFEKLSGGITIPVAVVLDEHRDQARCLFCFARLLSLCRLNSLTIRAEKTELAVTTAKSCGLSFNGVTGDRSADKSRLSGFSGPERPAFPVGHTLLTEADAANAATVFTDTEGRPLA